jgi:tRNA nucleotidyltransferase (CCA-adding enzyme)
MAEKVPGIEKHLSAVELAILEKLGELAAASGMEAWLVGGLVRDLILGLGAGDLDVVVEGDGLEFAKRASRELGANLIEYERFLTATLQFPDLIRVDIATARTETYENPGSLPRVVRATVKEDMRRRDFSINAMALSIMKGRLGELYDPFGGAGDLAAKSIRVLHDRSFIDDPTRMLRAARFEARFGFNMDAHTVALLHGAVAGGAFESISADRLREELFLAFAEPDPGGVFSRLEELGVLADFLPGVKAGGALPGYLQDAHHVSALVEKGKEWDPAILGLLLLVRGISPEQSSRLADRLNLNANGRRVVSMAGELPELAHMAEHAGMSGLHGLLNNAPLEVKLAVLVMMEGEANRRLLVEYMRQGREARPELTGDDLLAMGYTRGPVLKRILDALLNEKLDGRVHTRAEEEEFVRENFNPPDGEASA